MIEFESVNGVPWEEYRRRLAMAYGIVTTLERMPEVRHVEVTGRSAKATRISLRIALNLDKRRVEVEGK